MYKQRIVSHLAKSQPVPHHGPWPRYDVEADVWTAIGPALDEGGVELLGHWADAEQVHLAIRSEALGPCVVSLSVKAGNFPSIGRYHPPAIRLERAIHDLYGFTPVGAPDGRPWLGHGAWGLKAPLGACETDAMRDRAVYDFLPAEGENLHQIPVGPVHAGIIEPAHFRFTANGETIVRLEQRLGYAHRGIDGLLTDADIERARRVVARILGDSTVAYSFAFARAVEAALQIEVPQRAHVLRGVMAELERIANHFGDIGAICNDAGFAVIHAQCGIFRERVLRAANLAFGHRLMMDRIVPGGVEDMAPDGARDILLILEEIEPQFIETVELYDNTASLQDRTCTTGFVDPELVKRWAPGGFVGRASGRNFDARRNLAYPPYQGAEFDVPVFDEGDVNARVWVRIREVEQSIRLLKGWLSALPTGPVQVPIGVADEPREGVAVTEAFRGDVLIWVRVTGGRIVRCHARDASWFQWPLLEVAVKDNIVADFPLCNKSFNCCSAGHDL